MTMFTLLVRDVLSDRVLVTRESARLLADPLATVMLAHHEHEDAPDTAQVTVDFDGVGGVAPSFLDELLLVFESVLEAHGGGRKGRLIVANAPTRISLKFEAVARGHAMSIRLLPDGSWLLSKVEDAPPE